MSVTPFKLDSRLKQPLLHEAGALSLMTDSRATASYVLACADDDATAAASHLVTARAFHLHRILLHEHE
jgi:hypothetical protein